MSEHSEQAAVIIWAQNNEAVDTLEWYLSERRQA